VAKVEKKIIPQQFFQDFLFLRLCVFALFAFSIFLDCFGVFIFWIASFLASSFSLAEKMTWYLKIGIASFLAMTGPRPVRAYLTAHKRTMPVMQQQNYVFLTWFW
jgi:hypothetical protein